MKEIFEQMNLDQLMGFSYRTELDNHHFTENEVSFTYYASSMLPEQFEAFKADCPYVLSEKELENLTMADMLRIELTEFCSTH